MTIVRQPTRLVSSALLARPSVQASRSSRMATDSRSRCPGQADVAVLNLAKQAVKSVTVPVAALGYANGSWVTVATAEDYYEARRTFQVSGGAITLPLTGWTVAAPIGWRAPTSTLPVFGIFILRKSF